MRTKRRPPVIRPGAGRAATAGAVLLVGLVLVSACSLRGDDKPEEIPRNSLPPELFDQNASTGPGLADGRTATIFLVRPQGDGQKLQPKTVSIGRPIDDVHATLEKLLGYVPATNEPDQPGSSLSHGTSLRGMSRESDGVNLDLTNFTVEGANQWLAIAQLVFTATESGELKWVRFSIDGKRIAVPLGDLSAPPGSQVRRRDFRVLGADATTPATAPPGSTAPPGGTVAPATGVSRR